MNAFVRPTGAAVLLALTIAASHAQMYLQEGKSANATWVGGGTNSAEIEALRERQKDHTLKLMFTLNAGNYLAGVDVTVVDAKGATVLEQRETGPILLARLPRGRYTVTATSEGRTEKRSVQIGDRLHSETMRWPAVQGKDFTGTSRESAVVGEKSAPQ